MSKSKTFDLTTHKRNTKTGQVIATNPYRLEIKQGTSLYERPPGSGNWYYPNGQMAKKGKDVVAETSVDKVSMPKEKYDALISELALLKAEKEELPEPKAGETKETATDKKPESIIQSARM